MGSSIILAVIASNLDYVMTPYSAESSAENGLSHIKDILKRSGFETRIIVSDPESIVGLGEPVIYTIFGPTLDYDLQAVITLLSLLQNGSSLLIVDDFGKANSLLNTFFSLVDPNSMFQAFFGFKPIEANITKFSIYINTSVVVLDAGSYWKNPANIIIKDFETSMGILSSRVNRVLARFATTLFLNIELRYLNGTKKSYRVPLPGRLGIMRTSPYSWLETDFESIVKGTATPDPDEYGGVPFALGFALEVGRGRIMIITDPDIFTNEAMKIAAQNGFDNEQCVKDIFSWLS